MKRTRKGKAIARGAIKALVLFTLVAPVDVNSVGPYEIDFSGIPSATTPEEAESGFAARAQKVTDYNACRSEMVDEAGNVKPAIADDEGDVELDLEFTTVAIAKLQKGGTCPGQAKDNIAQVNEALLKARVKRRSGTDFRDIPGCHRSGDYDVALRGLVAILYSYGPYGEEEHRNKLRPDVYAHVLHNLLNQRGPHDPNIMQVCFDSPCPLPCVPETENHILLIETSRYLTNRLLFMETGDSQYNNKENGLEKWMLRYLQQFLQNDFDEYNSRQYQYYSTLALQNLYEFADYGVAEGALDGRVKLAAQMVLDYISAKFAVSSNEISRSLPFRRLKENKDRTHLFDEFSDPQTQRFIVLSGMTNRLARVSPPNHANYDGRDVMQQAALGRYRVPELILDLVMNKSHRSYYQFIKHDGVELYWSSPEFLITAGGFWTPASHGRDEFNCYKDAGWAVPTTLNPTGGGVDYTEFIRIDGDRTRRCTVPLPDALCPCFKEDDARVNTCVAPGFACGINPIVPSNFDACSRVEGPWTFINATLCPNPANFYAAVYRKLVEPGGPAGWTFGFFEATSSRGLDFDVFKNGVLSRNGSLDAKEFEPNDYVTVTDRRIRFVPGVPACGGDYPYCGDKYRWGIISTGDPALGCKDRSNIGTWPLAEGDIINSDGHTGYLTVDNPFLNRRLILDMRNPENPERTEIEGVGRSDKEVWVDFNYGGSNECGTFESPYNTLAEGVRALPWNGGTLKIKSGSRNEVITMRKSMRIEAHGGTVTIGR